MGNCVGLHNPRNFGVRGDKKHLQPAKWLEGGEYIE